jgi:hypothetical protein
MFANALEFGRDFGYTNGKISDQSVYEGIQRRRCSTLFKRGNSDLPFRKEKFRKFQDTFNLDSYVHFRKIGIG